MATNWPEEEHDFVRVEQSRGKRASDRIYLRLSEEMISYLWQLAKLGIHGDTPTAVAEALVSRGIEDLLKDDFFLKVRRQNP
jgi:hypothetical protein